MPRYTQNTKALSDIVWERLESYLDENRGDTDMIAIKIMRYKQTTSLLYAMERRSYLADTKRRAITEFLDGLLQPEGTVPTSPMPGVFATVQPEGNGTALTVQVDEQPEDVVADLITVLDMLNETLKNLNAVWPIGLWPDELLMLNKLGTLVDGQLKGRTGVAVRLR